MTINGEVSTINLSQYAKKDTQ